VHRKRHRQGDQNGKHNLYKRPESQTGSQSSIKVVETLAPERHREAHIPGALNIPPERIKELAPQLLPNMDAEIITYCTNTH
jgi:rhodanese-related sulfurtransferase